MDQKQADYWFKYASLLFDLGKLKEAYRFLSNIDRTNRTPEVLKLGGMEETSQRLSPTRGTCGTGAQPNAVKTTVQGISGDWQNIFYKLKFCYSQ